MYVNHETALDEYPFKTIPYEHQRTALNKGANLLTCDAHFEHLPHVVYVSKKTIH